MAAALVVLHFWWQSRYNSIKEALSWLRRERDQLEQERNEIRKEVGSQQNALFDSMIEGVLLLDEKGRIQHANQTLLKMFVLTAERAVGSTIM